MFIKYFIGKWSAIEAAMLNKAPVSLKFIVASVVIESVVNNIDVSEIITFIGSESETVVLRVERILINIKNIAMVPILPKEPKGFICESVRAKYIHWTASKISAINKMHIMTTPIVIVLTEGTPKRESNSLTLSVTCSPRTSFIW